MAKVLAVLYDDPVDGYPKTYARDDIPKIDHYPDGQTTPTPSAIDFKPGELLGSVSGELGLRKFLEKAGHTLVVTSDKDGPNSTLEKELPDAEIVISQPFWPAYMTAERIAKAKKLKLIITAGIGSDHTDLQAAMERGITVAEVTYSNSISVSEHVVMMILALVRNYIPSYGWVVRGGWNIADSVERSYDLEGMNVGTVAAGRIGLAVLRRLKPFDVKLHYTDKHRLPEKVEKELGLTFHPTVESLVKVCDVVTINAPLHPETEHMFNDKLIGMMKRGSYIVNTARGKIVDRDAVVRALESGQLAGYAGDVWFPQPPPQRPSLAHHAPSRHDPAHLRHLALGAGALRRRHARDPGELFRRQADPHRISDRRQGQARRRRRPFLHRRRRHQGLRGSGEVQEMPDHCGLKRKRRRHPRERRHRIADSPDAVQCFIFELLSRTFYASASLSWLWRRLLGGLGFAPQLVGLGLRHLARVDQRAHAGIGYLLDVARHAGPQRIGAEPVLTAILLVVHLTIALLALGDAVLGHGRKRDEDEGEKCRARGGPVRHSHVSTLCWLLRWEEGIRQDGS